MLVRHRRQLLVGKLPRIGFTPDRHGHFSLKNHSVGKNPGEGDLSLGLMAKARLKLNVAVDREITLIRR
jgi:hypothetical protein